MAGWSDWTSSLRGILGLPDPQQSQGLLSDPYLNTGVKTATVLGLLADRAAPKLASIPGSIWSGVEDAATAGKYGMGNPDNLTTDQLIPHVANAAMTLTGTGMPGAEAGALGSAGGRVGMTRLAPDVAGGVGTATQFADRYPLTAPPLNAIDKTSGKPFLQKQLSDEALDVQKQRIAAQKDIDAGNYTPYYDPSKRFDVNPENYPTYDPTTNILMKKPAAQAKWDAIANSPEAAANLNEAYQRGLLQKDAAGNWYHMGQLEDAFVKEYGPAEGRRQFKEKFADAMAATTGGADPTSNLMMAHYGNYLKNRGEPIPASYDMPFPIGGRYVSGNMEQYDKMINKGAGVTPDNPKRYNFSSNFLGNTGATIDEQMSGLFGNKMAMPPTGTYGHFENAIAKQAEAAGVDPRYFQEVAWAGAKDAKTKGGFKAAPMIDIVNQAIERTARITGLSPSEVVRRGLVRSEMPLYSGAPPLGLLSKPPEE